MYLISSTVLSSRVEVLSLVVEEERFWGLKVFILLDVIFKLKLEVIVSLGVGWGSN